MAEAARVVEQMGANIVDVNMGCPVPKIAKHNAGCSLMREPEHAAAIVAAMTKAVSIPVTVKMRKGWDDGEINAPELAKRVEDAGARAIAIHGRTAKQSYSGVADWDFVTAVAQTVTIPVFGSGDLIEPEEIVAKLKSGVSGVYVGRGVLRNPWILSQARDLMDGRPMRRIALEERGRFLLDYMDLLLSENVPESGKALSRERWVINKIRALCSWYTKGFEGGAQFRIGVNSAGSIAELQELIERFFSCQLQKSA
jgi:tRNA-dihydrouridine synthase B